MTEELNARKQAEEVAEGLEPLLVVLTTLGAAEAALRVNHAMGFIRGQGSRIDNLRTALERIEQRLTQSTSVHRPTQP